MPDAEGVTLEPHSSCVCPTPIKGLGWVGGWVGVSPPPPLGGGGVGHLSVCGYAKILGGWVPELTPPPLGWLSKTLGGAGQRAGTGEGLGSPSPPLPPKMTAGDEDHNFPLPAPECSNGGGTPPPSVDGGGRPQLPPSRWAGAPQCVPGNVYRATVGIKGALHGLGLRPA